MAGQADNKCHSCGVRIGETDTPVVVYIVVGPAIPNMTPEEVLDVYGDRLSPFMVANLRKRVARTVWCGECAALNTANVPEEETTRIALFAEVEK